MIRSIAQDDDTALLKLNNAFSVETSFLDVGGWRSLVERARFAYVAPPDKAFLLAFDRKPAEVSPNFDWLAERYSGFVYIDRVVVAASGHGQGLGKALYERLFVEARAAGFTSVACEVNLDTQYGLSGFP